MKRVIPETSPDYDSTRIIERPDGFYWQSISGAGEYGPFSTLLEAVRDMQYSDDEGSADLEETVEEAEADLGIADWIDPETGEPAEDGIPPRLADE